MAVRGRTRQLSIQPGIAPEMLRLISEQRLINKEFDRRKPVLTPTQFIDNSRRPDARKNKRRIIFVGGTTNEFQVSDGTTWNTLLSNSVGFATPTITYATSYGAGSGTKALRADAVLKFPTALMADSSTLTLTDDTTDQTLTGTLGKLKVVPTTGFDIVLGQGTDGVDVFVNATTAPAVTITPQCRIAAGSRTCILPAFTAGGFATTVSESVKCWDASMPLTSGQMGSSASGFNATIVASDASMTITPGAGSGTANNLYGFRTAVFLINNATGSWADTAAGYFKGVRRLISSPTITTQAAVIVEPPTAGTSDQMGIYIRQQSAQATATNRYGIKIDTHNSGTNRWGLSCAEKIENTATDMITSASAKGFIGQYSDQANRYFRLRALYNGGAPSLTIDDVGTTLPTL